MRNFLIIRNKWLGLFILTFGCYITDSTASAELESQSLKNQEDINLITNKIDTINIDANSNTEKIDQLNKKLLSLQEQIGKNSVYIDGLKDSIRAFQQLDISSASADQDIINSLIRIQSKLNIIEDKIGTVGAVALDKNGNIAAATSTGGMTNKMPGRVGDTPIIGSGTWAQNDVCGVSSTGHGEFFIEFL